MKTQHANGQPTSPVPLRNHEEISRLAHKLYERAGRPQGKDLEHWFNAESMTEANFGYGNSHTEHDFSVETP